MKQTLLLLLLIWCVACNTKEDTATRTDEANLLSEVRVNNKIYDAYEYHNAQLIKEKSFGFACETNPSNEYDYAYDKGKLSSMRITNRGIYSDIRSQCDPDLGILTEERFEYDAQGRIHKVIRSTSYTVFTYNALNQIEKQVLFTPDDIERSSTLYRYDIRGNLIEEEDINGKRTYYEYDDKKNPYFYMKQRPAWVSPFNYSPHNVIRATGQHKFERTPLAYNKNGFPTQIRESSNGLIYTYIYR